MAKPPKCKVCGHEHWGSDHVWPDEPKRPVVANSVANASPNIEQPSPNTAHASPNRIEPASPNSPAYVANDMANASPDVANTVGPSTYRYRDADARRTYQREYMRRKRAGSRPNAADG